MRFNLHGGIQRSTAKRTGKAIQPNMMNATSGLSMIAKAVSTG